jgi:uncharacterized Zn-binding protein involved in type VI secretion
MPMVIRLGDTSSHDGAVISSATKTKAEGIFIARVGDAFDCPVHGVNAIASGSDKNLCEGAKIARDGDVTECGAVLIASATKTDFD